MSQITFFEFSEPVFKYSVSRSNASSLICVGVRTNSDSLQLRRTYQVYIEDVLLQIHLAHFLEPPVLIVVFPLLKIQDGWMFNRICVG